MREEAAEPGRGVNSTRRLLQYHEHIRCHPNEERCSQLYVSNRDAAALGVLEALGFEEQGGYVECMFDGSAGCGPGVPFATQTVNEALEEMMREQAAKDNDARTAAREKRLAAAEGRLTKQVRRAMKAKKKSGKAPLRGPNSQYLMRWTRG